MPAPRTGPHPIEVHLYRLGFPGELTDTERQNVALAIMAAHNHGTGVLWRDRGRIKAIDSEDLKIYFPKPLGQFPSD